MFKTKYVSCLQYILAFFLILLVLSCASSRKLPFNKEKIFLLRDGMTQNDVIKILGKPDIIEKSEQLSHKDKLNYFGKSLIMRPDKPKLEMWHWSHSEFNKSGLSKLILTEAIFVNGKLLLSKPINLKSLLSLRVHMKPAEIREILGHPFYKDNGWIYKYEKGNQNNIEVKLPFNFTMGVDTCWSFESLDKILSALDEKNKITQNITDIFSLQGSGSLKGLLIKNENYENYKMEVADKIYLVPRTEYSEKWFIRDVLGKTENPHSTILGRLLIPHMRSTIFSPNWTFSFVNLPSGEYYVTSSIKYSKIVKELEDEYKYYRERNGVTTEVNLTEWENAFKQSILSVSAIGKVSDLKAITLKLKGNLKYTRIKTDNRKIVEKTIHKTRKLFGEVTISPKTTTEFVFK